MKIPNLMKSRYFLAREYSTLQELSKKVYISMKSGLISLIMVQFSIQSHCWKAEHPSYIKRCKIVMHANCLLAKFAKTHVKNFHFLQCILLKIILYLYSQSIYLYPIYYLIDHNSPHSQKRGGNRGSFSGFPQEIPTFSDGPWLFF